MQVLVAEAGRPPNFGITLLPNLDGSATYSAKPSTPRLNDLPASDRSGAPRFEDPAFRYVWQVMQPACAKTLAPLMACGLAAKPCFTPHSGTAARFSLASDSSAVAPLYVNTAIVMMVRIAAIIATGRRNGRRSLPTSMNGSASRSTSAIVGTITVPRITVFGHLKIRSR